MEIIYLFIYWSVYFLFHSLLASSSIKKYVQKEWSVLFHYYRILYNLIAIVFLILIVKHQGSISVISLFETSVISSLVGYILVFFGVVIVLLSFKNYSIFEFLGLDFKQEIKQVYTLKITGLNKYVRHPLYFATLLLAWGYLLLKPTTSILVMNIVVSLYLIIGTRLEEKKLLVEFGEIYKTYIKNVPMLIPWFLKKGAS